MVYKKRVRARKNLLQVVQVVHILRVMKNAPCFPVGATVEFDSKRESKTYKAVVVRLPKTHGARVEVRTTCGKDMVVPPTMLRHTQIGDAEKARLVEEGQKFTEKREANQARNDAERVRAAQDHIDLYKLHRRQTVKYYAGGIFNGAEVEIVKVDREAGKVTVTNPKADLRDRAAIFGMNTSHLDNAKNVVTVWAYVVRP